MTNALAKKIVVVTDVSGALGRAIAEESLRHGAGVCLGICEDPAHVESGGESGWSGLGAGRCLRVHADARLEEDVDRLFDAAVDAFGRVDIVVRTAPRAVPATPTNPWDAWDAVIASELTTAFLVARRAVQEFLGQGGGGRLVVVSTPNAGSTSCPAAWAASDAGLMGLVRTVTKEYGRREIYANIVRTPPDRLDELAPGRRAETIAAAAAAVVVFLASDRASFINGERVEVWRMLPATGPKPDAVARLPVHWMA